MENKLSLKELEDRIYKMFVELNRICRKHNIKYSLEDVKHYIKKKNRKFLHYIFGDNYLIELPNKNLKKNHTTQMLKF